MSVDGETLATADAGATINGSYDTGIVRIFKYSTETNKWNQLGSDIKGSWGDRFGGSISLSANGETVAVGATQSSIGGQRNG